MFEAYQGEKCRYFVVEIDGKVLGGAGVAPLKGGDNHICELQKMYLLPQARGLRVGHALMNQCLEFAQNSGYQKCYLETMQNMDTAKKLYARHGFIPLSKPMGSTGHFGCDNWYIKQF